MRACVCCVKRLIQHEAKPSLVTPPNAVYYVHTSIGSATLHFLVALFGVCISSTYTTSILINLSNYQ